MRERNDTYATTGNADMGIGEVRGAGFRVDPAGKARNMYATPLGFVHFISAIRTGVSFVEA
jgi:hypothetical protein